MVHDNCWQIEVSYMKGDKNITIRDVPMSYHPESFAAIFHHDFPGTNMDEVCRKFNEIDVNRNSNFGHIIFIDGVRVAVSKDYFKAIYDTTKTGTGIYEAHGTKEAKAIHDMTCGDGKGIRHG